MESSHNESPTAPISSIQGPVFAVASMIPASFAFGIWALWFFAGTDLNLRGAYPWYLWLRDWVGISLFACLVSCFVAAIAVFVWGSPMFRMLAKFDFPPLFSAIVVGATPGILVFAFLDLVTGGTVLYFGLVSAIAYWIGKRIDGDFSNS